MYEVIYIVLIVLLAILVGESCFKYGTYFVEFCGIDQFHAVLLNQIMRIGFYLLTIGAGFMNVIHLPLDFQESQAIEILMQRIGNIMLVWGFSHCLNVILLMTYRFLKLNHFLAPSIMRFTLAKSSFFIVSIILLAASAYFDVFYLIGDLLLISLLAHCRLTFYEKDDFKQSTYALGVISILVHLVTIQTYHEIYLFIELLLFSTISAQYILRINKHININLAERQTKTKCYE